MQQYIHIAIFFLGLLVLSTWPRGGLLAQEVEGEAWAQTIRPREFDAATWDKLNKELDYSGKPKPEEKKEEKEKTPAAEPPDPPELSVLFKGIFVILLLILLGVLIYAIVQNSEKGSRKLTVNREEGEIDLNNLDQLEETLDKQDVDPFLRKAETDQDYHLAVRLHFLRLLKKLNEAQLIEWKKDRTNRVYLNQMMGKAGYADFRALTLVFERVWYGHHFPEAAEYEQIKAQFLAYLQTLSSKHE